MPSDWGNLVPEAVARDLIASAEAESAVLALGHTVPMAAGLEHVPVVSLAPTAQFVGVGGRKPVSQVEWTTETLQPEEIAVLCWVPDAYINDAGFPVWDSVRTEVAKAIARTLDAAVLYGTGAPASYPTGGIAALAGAALTAADALAAIDLAASAIEASGLVPDGIAAGTAVGSALRKAYREVAALPSAEPVPTIYGMPVQRTPAWDPASGDSLVGSWEMLLVGIRQDITFDLSSDATLTDGAGNVVISAFESDVTALRAYIRVAAAIAQPVQADGSGVVSPFAFADWTTPLGQTTSTSSRSKRS